MLIAFQGISSTVEIDESEVGKHGNTGEAKIPHIPGHSGLLREELGWQDSFLCTMVTPRRAQKRVQQQGRSVHEFIRR